MFCWIDYENLLYFSDKMKEELDLSLLEQWMKDVGLVILNMDDWLLVQRGSFDFNLEGEPHHSLQLLINMNLHKYIIRVWSRTFEKGEFRSIEELKSISKKNFLSSTSCPGYLEQDNTCLKHVEYPFSRWISASCAFLFSGDSVSEKVGICCACSETPISKVKGPKLESAHEALLQGDYVVEEKPEVLTGGIFEDAIEEHEVEVKQEMYEAPFEFDHSELGKDEDMDEQEEVVKDDPESHGDLKTNSTVVKKRKRTRKDNRFSNPWKDNDESDSDGDWNPKRPNNTEKKSTCEDCGAKFDNRSLLKKHERSEHAKFVCERCGLKLSDLVSLMAHKKDVHGDQRFNQNKTNTNTLPIPPWLESDTCMFCNQHCNSKEHLQNHMRNKHGCYKYNCHLCAEHRYFPKDIAEHVLDSHPGNETAHCPVCKGPIFFGSNVQDFVDHQKQCSKEVRSGYAREARRKAKAKANPEPKLPCHICGKMLTKQRILEAHVARHNRSELPFKCDFQGCDKAFPVLSELNL